MLALLPWPPPAAGQEQHRLIDDPRLEADSTLFPYEWPALNRLERALRDMRPALEEGDLARLSASLPAIRTRADSLAADSLPSLLVPRREELKGRMIVLRAAIDRAERLAPAAVAAPPRPVGEAAVGTGQADTLAAGGEGSYEAWWRQLREGAAAESIAASGAPIAAADAPAAVTSTSAAGGGGDRIGPDSAPPDSPAADSPGAPPADPVAAYLDAWRDVYLNAEALIHRLRNPAGPN